MSGEAPGRSPRVRVSDKRAHREHDAEAHGDVAADVAPGDKGTDPEVEAHDYLDDLKRLQAEFDNYRKRMMREQTDIAARASSRLIQKLLPVLDNLDRALEHEAELGSLPLIQKELLAALADEGLETIEALGQHFNPHLHEAVESHQDAEVSEPTCTEVYRRGYLLKGKVLRPAMVVVARPPEGERLDDAEGE
jgi:molecular chaperone GrpE